MKKKMLASLVLSTALTTSVLTYGTLESSAASYKLSKGNLVHTKTGKLVKGNALYKNVLYTNGKRSTKTVLYKNKLYVKGKIKSGVVQYKSKFYQSGKAVSANSVFLYKEKLYKGNKRYPGFKTFYSKDYGMKVLFKDGSLFTGIYNNTLYNEGFVNQDFIGAKPNYNDSTIFSEDGTKMTYYVFDADSEKVTINLQDIEIDQGATITSVKKITDANKLTSAYYQIEIENVAPDKKYQLKIKNIQLGKLGKINFEGTIYSLPSKIATDAQYKKIFALYKKYANYTPEQMMKITEKQHYEIMEYLMYIEEESTTDLKRAISSISQLLNKKIVYSPYFGELM